MVKLFEDKKLAALEGLVVLILIAIITQGPGILAQVITPDSQLAPLLPYLPYIVTFGIPIVTYIAYQVLSPEGYSAFREQLSKTKAKVTTATAQGIEGFVDWPGITITKYLGKDIADLTNPEYWTGKLMLITTGYPSGDLVSVRYKDSISTSAVFDKTDGIMWASNPDPWGVIKAQIALKNQVLDAFVAYIKLYGNVDWKGISIGPAITGDKYDEIIQPWVTSWGGLRGITEYNDAATTFIAYVQAEENARADAPAAEKERQYAETMAKAQNG